MPRSEGRTRDHRPTAIVIGLVILVAIVAVGLLIGVVGGGDDSDESTAKRHAGADSTRPSTTTSTTTRPEMNYTVARGQNLTALARVFGVSKAAIVEANPGLDADHLVEGQTILIPSPTPVQLTIKPRKTVVGGSIEIKLKGAKELELVRFQIDRPTQPFIGPSHTATEGGVVTASYELGIADPPGTYTVTAAGDQGTSVQATFIVEGR
jgi:LysM repeat protein